MQYHKERAWIVHPKRLLYEVVFIAIFHACNANKNQIMIKIKTQLPEIILVLL